jgi:dihydrolipoamide dehydrogenase
VIVGATFTGAEVADFRISPTTATFAVVGEIPIARLRHATPPFPTRSEVWLGRLAPVAV